MQPRARTLAAAAFVVATAAYTAVRGADPVHPPAPVAKKPPALAAQPVAEPFPASAESSFAVLPQPADNADLLATLPAIPPAETRCLVTFRGYLDLDGRPLTSSIAPVQVVDGSAQLITATQVQSRAPLSEGRASLGIALGPLAHGAFGGEVTAVVRFVAGQVFRFGCRLSTQPDARGPSLFRCDVSYMCF